MEQATADRAVTGASSASKDAPGQNPHGDAWGALTRTHAAIVQRLQEMLSASDFPPLPWYEVLATVAEAPGEQMRMGDLAEALVITRGGLTKLVDRLVKAGLLERVFCATDRRVSYAALTPAGRAVIAEPEVAFPANLSVAQANELRETLDSVRGSACSA